jgi:hypothetical protein
MTQRKYLSSIIRVTRVGLLAVASLAICASLSQITFAQADPEVINLQSGSIPMQHSFGRNADDDLIHYYWYPAAGWQAENLTQRPNIGNDFRIQRPHGLKVINGPTYDAGAPVQHVFGRNSSGHLIHYYWIKSLGWAAENLTTGYSNIGTAYRIFGEPEVINLQSGSIPMQHVFGRSSTGDLIHYYWYPAAGWQAENLTQRLTTENPPQPPNTVDTYRLQHGLKVINGPTSDAGAPVQHVFGRNSSGDLIHYYWIKSLGWAVENLTGYSNIGPNFSMDN